MTMNINFPNLGIYLENVGKSFSVFGFEIAFYGITIAVGVMAGIAMAVMMSRHKERGELFVDRVNAAKAQSKEEE